MFLKEFDAAEEESTKAARTALLEFFTEQAEPGFDAGAVTAIFGELVANVCIHAPRRATVAAGWRADGTAILEVIDRGPGVDLSNWQPANDLAEGGRGLVIANAFSGHVNISPGPGGRGTWVKATLPVRRGQPTPA